MAEVFRQLVVSSSTEITLRVNKDLHTFSIDRHALTEICNELLDRYASQIESALADAGIAPHDVSQCLLLGHFSRVPLFHDVHQQLGIQCVAKPIDPVTLACGVAQVSGSELFSNSLPLPLRVVPNGCLHSGVALALSNDSQIDPRRMQIVIPRLTALPIQLKKRIKVLPRSSRQYLKVVEVDETNQSHQIVSEIVIEPSKQPKEVVVKLFVNEDGLLSLSTDQSNSTTHPNLDLQTIDHSRMSLKEIQKWRSWCQALQM